MELTFPPEFQKELDDLAERSGLSTADLVKVAVRGYVEAQRDVSSTLDSRYDDIKSGRVKLIDGEEAFARLEEKARARRAAQGA